MEDEEESSSWDYYNDEGGNNSGASTLQQQAYTLSSSMRSGFREEEEDKVGIENVSTSKSVETLEAVLQKVLRSLCALADNFDQIVSSLEADRNHSLVHRIGNKLWSRLRSIKLVTDDGKSPTWVCFILVLLMSLALLGITSNLRQQKPEVEVEQVAVPAKRVHLPDGRAVAYQEQGVSARKARHSVLVVHGFLSSRLAGVPGVNQSLLEEFGVRLVSYDLPGFGESDPHHSRDFNTSASDMEFLANELGLGEKFWLLVHAGGGPHAWAAMRYIPERLAGVAMISPSGNPYGGNLTIQEAEEAWKVWSFRRRLLHFIARRFPSLLRAFMRRTLLNKITRIRNSLYATLGKKDQALLRRQEFLSLWETNLRESMKQHSVLPLAQELLLLVNDWGFDLGDLKLRSPQLEGLMNKLRTLFSREDVELEGFKQPIHLWQGTDDVIVPAVMSDFARRVLPHINLYKLQDEGHFSWFYFCDECHRVLFETMLGKPEGPCLPPPEEQIIVQVVNENDLLKHLLSQ